MKSIFLREGHRVVGIVPPGGHRAESGGSTCLRLQGGGPHEEASLGRGPKSHHTPRESSRLEEAQALRSWAQGDRVPHTEGRTPPQGPAPQGP